MSGKSSILGAYIADYLPFSTGIRQYRSSVVNGLRMLQLHDSATPRKIGFLLLPRFSMICLLSAVEPLRGANRTLGYEAYQWSFFSVDGRPVEASNGIPIAPGCSMEEIDQFPAVSVVASYDPLATVDRSMLQWLRRLHRQGADIGAFETGPVVLAESGLLAGRRVTLHWETLAAFRERYLDIDARDSLFEIDTPVFTCSGGTAAMDLVLHLIARHHGEEVAASVSEQFLHTEIRAPDAHQRMAADRRVGVRAPELARATEIMQANLEAPLSLATLAERCGIGHRRLERLFIRHLGLPPQRYYLRLRLERARHLLRHGGLRVHEVGLACGFGSASWFARAYRGHFGHPPTAERRNRDRA